MIGRGKSRLMWLGGSLCALLFGGVGCGRSEPPALYGPPPKPPAGAPADPNKSDPGKPDPAKPDPGKPATPAPDKKP